MKKIIFALILLFTQIVFAQDPIFTQSFSIPETLNTGFTGALENPKAGIIHRTQWAGLNFSINTQFAFFDTWIDTYNTGIGISVLNHQETTTRYNFTQINFNYAYALQLSDKWYFRPSISAGLGNKDLGFQDLLLEDQIDISNNIISTTSIDPMLLNQSIFFFDFSASLLFNTERTWIGATVKHINKPDISLTYQGNNTLNLFISTHAAIEFPLSNYNINNSVYFLSNYMQQGSYSRLDIGTQYVYDNFSIGVLAATNPLKSDANSHFLTSINPFIAMKWEGFKFSYSYDFNLSEIGKTGGIYEMLITYDFSSTGSGNSGRYRGRRLKCPTWF